MALFDFLIKFWWIVALVGIIAGTGILLSESDNTGFLGIIGIILIIIGVFAVLIGIYKKINGVSDSGYEGPYRGQEKGHGIESNGRPNKH